MTHIRGAPFVIWAHGGSDLRRMSPRGSRALCPPVFNAHSSVLRLLLGSRRPAALLQCGVSTAHGSNRVESIMSRGPPLRLGRDSHQAQYRKLFGAGRLHPSRLCGAPRLGAGGPPRGGASHWQQTRVEELQLALAQG